MDPMTTVLCGAVAVLFLSLGGVVRYVKILHEDQLDECREGRRLCEEKSKRQERQIDALIDGDHGRARDERSTDAHEALVPKPAKRPSVLRRMISLRPTTTGTDAEGSP